MLETYDLTESEIYIIRMLRSLKPKQKLEIWADNDGRPDVYILHERTERIIFPNKQVYLEIK